MVSGFVSRLVRRLLASLAAVAIGSTVALTGGCQTAPQQFDSPEQAVDAVVAALRPEVDRARLLEIFGSEAKGAMSSGDAVADANAVETFLDRFDQGHRLVSGEGDSRILEIGAEQWPFAFPLVPVEGRWQFDVPAGVEELANRRIGENELDTIQALLAVVDAQREYAWMDIEGDGIRAYAARFGSDAGTRNGLYWPTGPGEYPSPLGNLADAAEDEGYRPGGTAYHGYRFRMLTAQGPGASGGARDYMVGNRLIGGFAVVAWPVQYGISGVKTFIVNHEGTVFERDLGPNTAREAAAIKAFDPAGWAPVTEE